MIVRNVDDVARAVFVLQWSGNFKLPEGRGAGMMGGQGTAFAYKRQNRLVTCQHVLVDTTVIGETTDGPEGQVMSEAAYTADVTSPYLQDLSVVAINPVNGREWPVRVVHMDPGRDLALLEFVGEPPEHRHFSGMDSPIPYMPPAA
jgi:S1-C subfamily serine protease